MSTRATKALERRKVGTLGGMGPMATQAFYRELILQTRASADEYDLDVVIVSDPENPDRTDFLLGHGTDPLPALVAAAERLEAAGAELVVMPCNTAQAFLPQLESRVGIPFVPWVDSAVDTAVAIGRPPIAVLATRGTLQVDIYGPVLERRGMAYLVPTDDEVETVMSCIYDYKARHRATRPSQSALVEVASGLRNRGARSFLLACTELPLILPPSSRRWLEPAIDPAIAAARRTVVAAGAVLARP